ncbi:MAG: SDR family NAD(P)-dependent oxidoreductase, partial [Gammaproteobacteria bacterium]|nr:SDR family NAD(P)-dependent oxidoreductase [Gammaproteobacteria bacterium]
MKKILILGATSAIAEKLTQAFAAKGDSLYLVARNKERLTIIADDLQVRNDSDVYTHSLDLTDTGQHETLLQSAESKMGGLDIVMIAYGTLSDQKESESSFKNTLS